MLPDTTVPPRRPSATHPTRPTRWRRPTWRDPRLAGGIVIVACAVALGAWAVDAAADTEQIYALTRDVAPGTDLTAEGVLTLVSSHPGTGSYVELGSLPEEAVATRSLSAGELLPTAAVAQADETGRRAVLIEVAVGLPSGTGTGDFVDLWRLPGASLTATTAGGTEATSVAEGLIVAAVGQSGSSLVGGTTTTVEVLVPAETLGAVLTAVGSGGQLVLVPAGQDA